MLPRTEASPCALPATQVQDPTIELLGVHKNFSAGSAAVRVLHDLELTVATGEVVAIVGRSGSGKTTLLNLLGGLDRAERGTLRVCGERLDQATPEDLTAFRRRRVGFVFQSFNLFPTLTALENVALGPEAVHPPRAAAELSRRWLAAVGLEPKAACFPYQLSGGEQQRVAIARALAKEPSLLLADEPTGNLDAETAGGVLELMAGLHARACVTVVLATHDPAVLRLANRTLALRDGRLAAAGA